MAVSRTVLHAERRAFRTTLDEVGPDAPTWCPPWTAADMAAHVVSGEIAGGTMSYVPRHLVARGVRIGSGAVVNRSRDLLLHRLRRKGFDWALDRLDAPPPRLLSRGRPGLVTFFETWVHHEDVRRANGMGPDPVRESPALQACLAFAFRYQRKPLGGYAVEVATPDGESILFGAGEPAVTLRGPLADALLWLVGRPAGVAVEVVGLDPSTGVTIDRLAI